MSSTNCHLNVILWRNTSDSYCAETRDALPLCYPSLGEETARYLDRGLVQVTQVGCGLSWFVTQHHHVGIDQSEGINNNLKKTEEANQSGFLKQ